MLFYAIGVVIFAYLVGSINFAVIFSNVFLKKDVRNMGSGNAGATNVLRNAGVLPGVLTFVCDAIKGFVASFAGKLVFDCVFTATNSDLALPIYGAYLCGLACMLGHVFPIFFQFKGGKGVATSVGIFAVCCPIAIISGLGVFAIITLLSRYVSLASIMATLVVVTLSLILHDKSAWFIPQAVLCVSMGILVIAKHKENIKRLIKGTESKIGGKKHG